MPGGTNRLRAVVYEAEFDAQLEQLRSSDQGPGRVDDVVAGVEWATATADDLHTVAESADFGTLGIVFVAKTDPAPPDVPALRFFFTVDPDGTVHMRYVEEDPTYSDIG